LMAFPPRMTSPATGLYLSSLLWLYQTKSHWRFSILVAFSSNLLSGSFNIAGVYRRHAYCLLSSFVCGSLIPRDFLFIPSHWCTVGFESIHCFRISPGTGYIRSIVIRHG
jgi:hypothetical protein